jgi:hypothetical protein
MQEKYDGGSAFPTPKIVVNEQGQITGFAVDADGMTLRDYFAAKAMQSLIVAYKDDHSVSDEISKRAYYYADAMLEAREQE